MESESIVNGETILGQDMLDFYEQDIEYTGDVRSHLNGLLAIYVDELIHGNNPTTEKKNFRVLANSKRTEQKDKGNNHILRGGCRIS